MKLKQVCKEMIPITKRKLYDDRFFNEKKKRQTWETIAKSKNIHIKYKPEI